MAAPTATYKEARSMVDKCSFGFKMITGSLAFGAYETNGVAWDLRKFFPTEIHMIIFETRGGYVFEYDYTNRKIKSYYYDYNAGADGAAIEVANGTDQTTPCADVRFMAIGK